MLIQLRLLACQLMGDTHLVWLWSGCLPAWCTDDWFNGLMEQNKRMNNTDDEEKDDDDDNM